MADSTTPAVAASDLLPADAYGRIRPAYRARIIALKERRRVLIGPHVSLVFESRETVLYQIQEVLWVECQPSPERIAAEIAEYAVLVPGARALKATLMIHGGPPEAGRALVASLAAAGTAVFLDVAGRTVAAEALSPPCDLGCPVQYLRFPLDREAAAALAAGSADVRLGVAHAGTLAIVPLPRPTVEELAADLRAARPPEARPAPVSLIANCPS